MKEVTQAEKSCQNCRYFSQHYTKKGATFSKVFCGHCINVKNKKFKLTLCDFWESIEIQKAERTETIKERLLTMATQINETTLILNEKE